MDFRTWLLDQPCIAALVGGRIYHNQIVQADDLPAIWYRHGTSTDQDTMTLEANSGSETQFNEGFDVEAISEDVALTETIARALKSLQTYSGVFGTGKVQGVFIDDHTDRYIAVNTDAGRNVAALDFDVVAYKEP